MKLLIWSQHFWPENFHINAVAQGLKDQGVDVTVLTGKPNYPEGKIFSGYKSTGIDHENYNGIEVVRIPLIPRGTKRSAIRLALNYLSFIFSGIFIAPFALRKKKVETIFIYATSPLLQALPALYIGWLKRAKVVLWVQDLWPESLQSTGYIKHPILLNLVRVLVRLIYKYSDTIMIQSEGFRDPIEKLGAAPDKIHYFPNSSEDLHLKDVSLDQKHHFIDEMSQFFSIVFAGNLGTAQDCETIVKAADLIKEQSNIKIYLIGSGSMTNSLMQMIKERQLNNIVMPGRVPSESMPQIYNAASVLLLTLREDPALSVTIPSKLQSYLAAGKPIIVGHQGEAANVLEKANAGFHCEAENPQALADSILKMYKLPPEKLVELGQNGRQYFLTEFQISHRVVELSNKLKSHTPSANM